jgi:FkbM family methyltransferase
VAKLGALVRSVENWPRALSDHLGLNRDDYVCRLRNGLQVEIRGGTDDRHVVFEVFVEDIYAVSLAPGSVVVDVGAHIGCFSLLAAAHGARVFSFEPFPSNFAALQRNLARNHAADAHAFQVAVTGARETRQMFIPENSGHTGRFSLHPGRGPQTIAVPCTSFDALVAEHRLARIDLLKLDCQGSEYEILYGIAPATFERIRAIVAECEVFDAPPRWSAGALQAFLDELGFETVRRGNIVYAERTGDPATASGSI